MVKAYSTMMELGAPAIPFELPNFSPAIEAKRLSLALGEQRKGLLLAFICNHCPYVVRIAERLAIVANEAQRCGLTVIAINANDVDNYPADSPENMVLFAQQHRFEFPYLYDQEQQVALAYRAACTPDFFLFDRHDALVYRGQFDAARPGGSAEVTGIDLQQAIDSVLQQQAPLQDGQVPSVGCSIKWRAGNAPDYFT